MLWWSVGCLPRCRGKCTGRRQIPGPFGTMEQGAGSGGGEGNKTNQGFGRSKRKFFEEILQTSLIQSKETIHQKKWISESLHLESKPRLQQINAGLVGLNNTLVTCLSVGKKTLLAAWIRYERIAFLFCFKYKKDPKYLTSKIFFCVYNFCYNFNKFHHICAVLYFSWLKRSQPLIIDSSVDWGDRVTESSFPVLWEVTRYENICSWGVAELFTRLHVWLLVPWVSFSGRGDSFTISICPGAAVHILGSQSMVG